MSNDNQNKTEGRLEINTRSTSAFHTDSKKTSSFNLKPKDSSREFSAQSVNKTSASKPVDKKE